MDLSKEIALARSHWDARREAIGGWFRETSSLLAVLLLIDEILKPGTAVRWRAVGGLGMTGLILFVLGVFLTRGEKP